MSVIGHVQELEDNWYKLENGTIVSFHKLFVDKERSEDNSIIIYSDHETWPSETALKLGLKYFFMRNATKKEVENWMKMVSKLDLGDDSNG